MILIQGSYRHSELIECLYSQARPKGYNSFEGGIFHIYKLSGMWDLIVFVPDHCLSIYYTRQNISKLIKNSLKQLLFSK